MKGINNVDLYAIITAIIAIYGAILSTVVFVSRRNEKQRKLSVKFSMGFLTYGQELSDTMLFINISNPGNRDVTINLPSIILPDRKTITFPYPQSEVKFPHRLEEGTKIRIWTGMKDLARQLIENDYQGKIKLIAKVEDGAGKIYKSKKLKTNLEDWVT